MQNYEKIPVFPYQALIRETVAGSAFYYSLPINFL